MFTNYPVLRIYQNIIRLFFMLVLCQSGMGVILIIIALRLLCFEFVSKAVLTVFGLLLSSACTAPRLSLFPTLCPSVSGREGSEWVCGCWAVDPGHPTECRLWEAESQLHCDLGVAVCAEDDHPVRY